MPPIIPEFQLQQGDALPSWPSNLQPVCPEHATSEYGSAQRYLQFRSPGFRRGDRVLHPDWGIGRVLRTTEDINDVTVKWSDNVRSASTYKLRRLLPRTILAQMIELVNPAVTTWMVRKADENGAIRPDAVGRFAGHNVHYYDAARVPALAEALSKQDRWGTGTLVSHSDFGAGRIVGYASNPPGTSGARSQYRVIHFFSADCTAPVPVDQLRRLIPGHLVARRIGLDRKVFTRQAERHGIEPDFICPDRGRTYYDEDRIQEICRRWSAPIRSGAFLRGSLVVDPCGDLAKVEFVDENGGAHLRSLQECFPTQVPVTRIRELVSLRELARREKMSRYRLQRLLAAAQVDPVHRQGKTIYFDGSSAGQAIRVQLRREESALNLAVLSQRTGLSPEILAKKVRHGCIRTICRAGIHLVEAHEAERVQTVIAALNNEREGLSGLGICRFQPRGQRGQELVHWDIPRLLKAVQSVTADLDSTLFDQIAWVCEGVGQKRFQEALKDYISSQQRSDESTQSLLTVLDYLPACPKMCQIRLMLMAYRSTNLQSWLQETGKRGNVDNHYANWAFLERAIRAVLAKCPDVFNTSEDTRQVPGVAGCPKDEFVPGAVIISVRNGKLHPGVIVRVEQISWDAVARAWNKTIVIRSCDGEWHANPQVVHPANPHLGPLPIMCLLDASQAKQLFEAFSRTGAQLAACASEQGCGPSHWRSLSSECA